MLPRRDLNPQSGQRITRAYDNQCAILSHERIRLHLIALEERERGKRRVLPSLPSSISRDDPPPVLPFSLYLGLIKSPGVSWHTMIKELTRVNAPRLDGHRWSVARSRTWWSTGATLPAGPATGNRTCILKKEETTGILSHFSVRCLARCSSTSRRRRLSSFRRKEKISGEEEKKKSKDETGSLARQECFPLARKIIER